MNNDWEEFKKTVKPLKEKNQRPISSHKNKILNTQKVEKPNYPDNSSLLEIKTSNKIYSIEKNTLRKIQKGKIKIDGKLDLHGYNQNESKSKVLNFINISFENQKRLLLIITGKGERLSVSDGWKGTGILKENLPKWLKSDILSKKILWFDYAPKNKGGDGAILVYLRKSIK